jgi:hypothetical protein
MAVEIYRHFFVTMAQPFLSPPMFFATNGPKELICQCQSTPTKIITRKLICCYEPLKKARRAVFYGGAMVL